MLFGSRFWASVLMAVSISFSSLAMAETNEDYDLGVKRFDEGDMVGAMASLRKASATGHVKSMVLLAEILDRSEFDEEALSYYRKAADLGDPDGMFGLGIMTASGEGVKKNPLEGRRWVQKAAELGHLQAINVIAHVYLKGEMGLTESDRDTPESLNWVKLAAKNNYLPAVDALTEAYRNGDKLGVAADPALASEYLAQGNKLRGLDTGKGKKKSKKNLAAGQGAN